MRAIEVQQDALEPGLVVGAAGLIVRVAVDAPAINDQLSQRSDQLLVLNARSRELVSRASACLSCKARSACLARAMS